MTTTVTLTPQSTGLAANLSYTGGPTTVHGVTQDNSDGTFCTATANNGDSSVTMSTGTSFTMPAGAQIRSVTPRLRMKGNGATSYTSFGASLYVAGEKSYIFTSGIAVPNTITAYNLAPSTTDAYGKAWTAQRINQIWLHTTLNNGVSMYKITMDVVYSEQPSVGSVGPSGSQTLGRPTITWVYSTPDTAAPPQERWIVRVFTDSVVNAAGFDPETALAVFDSGSSWVGNGTANQYTVPTTLAAGTYWAYVKVADAGSGGRYSNWASSTFQVAGSPPAAPTLVSAVADIVNGRNVLTIQENDNLLGYNQAGLENGATDGEGWYIDSNLSTLTNGTSTADIEGGRALIATVTAAGAAKARSGGTWSTTGLGGSQNLSIDTHEAAGNANDGTAILATAAFTPASGAQVFAFIGSDGPSAANVNLAAEVSIGGGAFTAMTLVQQARFATSGTNIAATGVPGEASIWRVAATGASIVVRIPTISGYFRRIKVVSFTGCDATTPVGARGGGSATTVVNQNYTSTRAGSWGWMSYTDYYSQSLTAGSGCSVYSQTTDPHYTAATINRTSVTSASGSTVNMSTAGTGSRDINYCYMEVMPATGLVVGVPSTLLAGIPVQAGSTYTVNGRVWQATNAAKVCRIDVEWWAIDTTGTPISTTTGPNVTTLTTTRMISAASNVTAPTGAVAAVLILVMTPTAASEVYHWDQMGLTLGANQKWSRGGMQAQNLLDTDDGSADGSIGTWVALFGSANVSRVTNSGVKSGFSLQTYGVTNPIQAWTMTAPIPGVTVGQIYTFYAAAYTLAGTVNGQVKIQFEDDNGSLLSSVIAPPTSLSSTSLQVLAVSGLCPDGATKVRVIVIEDYVVSTNAVIWTRMGIVPGAVDAPVWQPGPLPDSYPLVEYSDDGGITWTSIRNTAVYNFDPTNGWLATVYDYEAPPNLPRMYRASVAGTDYGIDPNGFHTVSAPSNTLIATLPVNDWYLVDPFTNQRVVAPIIGDVPFTSDEPQGKFDAIGRKYSIIQTDVTKGETFSFKFAFNTGADYDTFNAMRNTQHVLLLKSPGTRYWYIKFNPSRSTIWQMGTMTKSTGGNFTVDLPASEVERPD